jgi:hypothetical protein
MTPKVQQKRVGMRRAVRRKSPDDELPAVAEATSHIVAWRRIERLAVAITDIIQVERVDGLSDTKSLLYPLLLPYLLLNELQAHARSVLLGSEAAKCKLRARLTDLAVRSPDISAAARALAYATATSCDCQDFSASGAELTTLDFDALLELLAAVYRINSNGQKLTWDTPGVAEVVGLAALCTPLEKLHAAHAEHGEDGLVREMQWMAATALPPLQRTMGLGAPGPPPGWGAPGLPPLPGKPTPGKPPLGPDDDTGERIKQWLTGLVHSRRKPFHFDPEIWDHRPIFKGPSNDTRTLQCLLAYGRFVNSLPDPPARPAKVIWSDNITSVTATQPCAGATVVIRGAGFGQPKPANIALVLALDGVCTPIAIPASKWSDTKIEVKLPPNITSSAVGFVDLNYVNAYNAWADQINAAWQQVGNKVLAACARHRAPPPTKHFAECPPVTPVNYLSAGAATIKSFTVNGEAITAAEPSDGVLLEWETVNAIDVRLERTSPSGPLLGGALSVNSLPAVGSYLLDAPNHSGPQLFTYRLTAVGPCGDAVKEITVVATKEPRLRIESIEVTQGIQRLDQSVRLVAQKPTVVRVTVRHGLNGWGSDSVPKVAGRMRVYTTSGSHPWVSPLNVTPGNQITVVAAPQRANTNDTLNFLAPTWLCVGDDVRFEVEIRVNGFDARSGFAGYSESASKFVGPLTFTPRRALDFRYIRVNWAGSPAPNDATCQQTLLGAVPLLPAPFATVTALAGVGAQNPASADDNGRDGLLDDFDDRHNCSTLEALTEWLGSDCPDDDGAIWVLIPGMFYRGKAYDIPSNVCFTPPNDGRYAAHELSHCLYQRHLTAACGITAQALGGDLGSSWSDGGQVLDVPFDVTRNSTVTDPKGVWDVMTYCAGTWPTVQRWDLLWNVVGS